MKVWHKGGYSFVQGKVSEQDKILEWIKLANCEVIVDECDEDDPKVAPVFICMIKLIRIAIRRGLL